MIILMMTIQMTGIPTLRIKASMKVIQKMMIPEKKIKEH